MIAAGGLQQTNAQAATFQMVNALALEALRRGLYPLKIDGAQAYILVISPLNATIYADPTWSNNTAGAVWIQQNKLSDSVQRWNGIIGKWTGTIGCDIYVVRDERCPSLIPGGTAEPYSLTAGYNWPGGREGDRRQHDNPLVRDAAFFLGQNAITKWEPEKLHNVTQPDDYGRIEGHGAAGVRGIQITPYDQQNPNATSLEYYGGMVVVMARPNYY
jgi:hypothetical protein